MPPPEPFSKKLLEMSDEEIERRAADDPDAGVLPPDFWDKAVLMEPLGTEQVTLRLPRRVLAHFRAGGKGYQSRISKVLSHYVDAQGSKAAGTARAPSRGEKAGKKAG
jgi:uncharacterized protein (DUF4415 family)